MMLLSVGMGHLIWWDAEDVDLLEDGRVLVTTSRGLAIVERSGG